ncbi:DinB family protein [Flammeovirga sp. EKP202]|uniref:DinB family protein n=1 Tax=Flammeovirga sp. EKP202 TaxID=2770592 RepID=UPI00165FEA2D|nr:DinB family protein [Flammeovirga sp. EKP202]MBD0401326.1 DinB family protein [Flammeovirga sp. EKP202]
MRINQAQFLATLQDGLEKELIQVKKIQQLPLAHLQYRKYEKAWNILECLYHLNLYGEFYIPQFQHLLKTAKDKQKEQYKSGWLGNYFANSMKPSEQKIKNKMPSPKEKNPLGLPLESDVITTRIQQINKLLIIVEQAKNKDLEQKRCPITISKWITLQLGDTIHFIINHEERHMLQIKKILLHMEKNEGVNT